MHIRSALKTDSFGFISVADATNIIHVLDYLEQNNLSFGQVYTQLPTLNDVFLEITGKELRD